MKQLPTLAKGAALKGKRVLIRVDWNIPLHQTPTEGDLLKIERSAETINWLKRQGAIVIVATHLGRPKQRDLKLSTVRLLPFAEAYLFDPVLFCGEDLLSENGMIEIQNAIEAAKNGSVLLLENVRFYDGEDKNDKKLAARYAMLADIYMNDAFASCHRKHASVSAVSGLLPHYAGPGLQQEVTAIGKLIAKPKKPFVAVIGGAKLSTKLPVISALLKKADHILIGGAMAHAFLKAKRLEIGKSYLEEGSIKLAQKIIKNKKIHLPEDAIVAKSIKTGIPVRRTDLKELKKTEMICDIGPKTMQTWSSIIKSAGTILWNGPLGVYEISTFSHGSLVIGYAIASRAKGKAYGVVGGGDTIPVAIATGMDDCYDHISTGGGALLEFIAKGGKLPGLEALKTRQIAIKHHLKKSPQKIVKKSSVIKKKSANKK